MTVTRTRRFRLWKESSDEYIDQWAQNWPILETAAGIKMVDPGMSPPTSELYDGCFVAEKTTDIVWMASFNPDTLALSKKWVTYPFIARITGAPVSVPNSTGTVTYFDVYCHTWTASEQKNFNGPVAGRIVVPVTGLYCVNGLIQWAGSSTGARGAIIQYNATNDSNRNEDQRDKLVNNTVTTNVMTEYLRLNAGSVVGLAAWQNSGAALSINFSSLVVELISPL